MNKHSSITNFKTVSRQKQKDIINLSKFKVESRPNNSAQMEKGNSILSKSKYKQAKSSHKVKKDNNRPQTAIAKNRNQNKQQNDQYRIDIKADLKHLIIKNNTAKRKNSEIVPELIKNIETGCKALKNIHHKQKLFQDKRSSEHSNKSQKSKKKSIQCLNNEKKRKLRQNENKDTRDPIPIPPKISRFSLQMNESDFDKMKIEQKLRQNASRKSTENKEQQKNFVEIYKLYKKSFEIQQFKIGKSNKNTNYNTNQSKNSSSHHNSHCPSRLRDFNLRGKSREQEINNKKIEMLIKNQQRKAGKVQLQEENLLNIQKVYFNQREEMIASKMINKQSQHYYVKQWQNSNKSSAQSNAAFLTKHYEANMVKNLQNERLFQLREGQNQQDKKMPSHEQKPTEVKLLPLQKNFQKSKFYVKPLLNFQPRNKQNLLQDQSLEGCQITLIESNILVEDSRLASLQL